jgi:glyoxylase-like metal-dependent hydrolase (beta-lactamase superfamily II)
LTPRPINVYVIEHARGLLLFDTGQDRASVTDDSYFPGGFTGVIYDRLARFHVGEEEALDAQLGTLGYSAAEVDTAILSHLHQDHMGGIRELSRADLLVAAAEWEELSRFAPEPRGFLRKHIMIPGRTWNRIGFEPTNDPALTPFTDSLDVMGDGSLVLLPTPGHTAGSVSLLVRRRARPPLLLVGDLTYGAELLERRQLPASACGAISPRPPTRYWPSSSGCPAWSSCRRTIRPRPSVCSTARDEDGSPDEVHQHDHDRPSTGRGIRVPGRP